MSILDVQQRYRELGRIRFGAKNEKGYPVKLEQLRFTSPNRDLIEAVAAAYGGEVQPWKSPRGDEWEVITEAASVDCVIPPQRITETQHYELWGQQERGKPVELMRRCNGQTQTNGDPCICDPDERDCKPRTHLLVMLPQLPGLGVWRVTTQGFHAAAELPATVDLLARLAEAGAPVAAKLSLRHDRATKDGQVHRFVVPQVDIQGSAADLVASLPEGVGVRALTTGGSGRKGPGGSPPSRPIPAGAPSLPDSSVTPITEAPSVRGSSETASDAVSPADIQPPTRDEIETLLRSLPDESDTMAVWETYVRLLFHMMEDAGHWLAVNSNGQDSLHAALDKLHSVPHLGDLRKAELVAFTKRAHAAAAAKLGAE